MADKIRNKIYNDWKHAKKRDERMHNKDKDVKINGNFVNELHTHSHSHRREKSEKKHDVINAALKIRIM